MSTTTATLDSNALHGDTGTALRFITCGSVDDGKSTLIGRLLVDSKTVLQDQLAGVQRGGETDLALLTDGLSAEREQGITIDVAYRYFSTAKRKFIIGDAPGHEQYTRNMVTAASAADAAVVLVDATKLAWAAEVEDGTVVKRELLPQTRRHTLLTHLLRVQSIVFAVNKLDAIDDAALAFERISTALNAFAEAAGVQVAAIVPISALKGWNVATRHADWVGYEGPSLLELLEELPVTVQDEAVPFAFPVQWVEKFSSSADTSQGRRVFWGRVASGHVEPGQRVTVLPSNQTATVAQVLSHTRQPKAVHAGHSAGIVLDREVDVSRGDWLLAPECLRAGARNHRHRGLARRRAAGCGPRLLGAAGPSLGQGQGGAHRRPGEHHDARIGAGEHSWRPIPSATWCLRCSSRWPFCPSRNRAHWAPWCWSIRPPTRPLLPCSCSLPPQRPKIWGFPDLTLTLKDK